MSDLLKIVKARLEKEMCPEHQEKPIITLKNENLALQCCCESFREKTFKQMKIETEKATVELVSKMFKK